MESDTSNYAANIQILTPQHDNDADIEQQFRERLKYATSVESPQVDRPVPSKGRGKYDPALSERYKKMKEPFIKLVQRMIQHNPQNNGKPRTEQNSDIVDLVNLARHHRALRSFESMHMKSLDGRCRIFRDGQPGRIRIATTIENHLRILVPGVTGLRQLKELVTFVEFHRLHLELNELYYAGRLWGRGS